MRNKFTELTTRKQMLVIGFPVFFVGIGWALSSWFDVVNGIYLGGIIMAFGLGLLLSSMEEKE